ncbi:uncharacterized protein LOC128215907 [Mya arenaria]|uniref:uncharacterized protein LOC128215907 n=1 Tax=Mya arenaria TaxID=6604 RepID=UPI0022E22176|nr:uncharacterized protein LOC128215907 [Mya arenaria]
METSWNKVLMDIKVLRVKINGRLDTIEKRTITEMIKVMAPLVESLTKDVDKCNDMRDRLKRLIDEIKSNNSESLAYVGFTKCKSLTTEANSVCKEMITTKDYELVFQPGSKVETTVSSIDTFGEIFDANHVFTVHSIMSKTIDNFRNFRTTGACEMPNGTHVLCSINIYCEIVLLAENFKAVARLQVPEYHEAICYIGENELAVAITSEMGLRLIKVTEGKLEQTKKFRFNHYCRSVAHHDNQLYVTSEAALFQYTKTGQLVKQLFKTGNADIRDKNVIKCALNNDGSKIFILNKMANKILTLDRDGNVLSDIKDSEISEPCAICVSSFGYVFVACTNYVLQIERNGRKKLTRLVKISPDCMVTSLHHVNNTNSLIMGKNGHSKEQIDVLKLK